MWEARGSDKGAASSYPCGKAIHLCAVDKQFVDMRGDVSGDTAWELACRILLKSNPDMTKTLGSREIAQLIVYILEKESAQEMREILYEGMHEDLEKRGKTVETVGDVDAMRSRWIKQRIHGELDSVRETVLGKQDESHVELDVECRIVEGEQQPLGKETEKAASELLAEIEQSNRGEPAVHIPASYWQDCEAEVCSQGEQGARLDWCSCEAPAIPDSYWQECADELCTESEEERPQDDVPVMTLPAEAPVGKPVLDAPEFAERIRDTDKEAYWIPGAFPTIFQNETGDPHRYAEKVPELVTWGPHILRSRGWVAQTHMTFMYWWLNMTQRIKALSAKKWFVRDNPNASGFTAQDLKKMGVHGLARKMTGYTANIPGTKSSKVSKGKGQGRRWVGNGRGGVRGVKGW